MTTIIDGVDVSECAHYYKYANKEATFLHNCTREHAPFWSCASMPNCLYKKYKRKEQECDELKKELEATKGLVTVGNRQLAIALLELQTYKDKEQKEKEENEKLYKKLEGSCLIGKHWRFK